MTVTDRNDGGKVSIDPHQTVLIQGDQIGAPRPIALSRSTLKIASSLDVLPLVEMPDQQRAAGFVSPGVEVNQVFGSFTGIIAGMRVVEVPAGEAGPFTLVLAGTESDPYLVRVTAQVDGQPVSSENISGYLARGSQQSMQITLVFQADSAGNPATAVVDHAEAGPLLAFFGDDVLGKVLLSPSEVARIVGN
jgi:hypothetical protein